MAIVAAASTFIAPLLAAKHAPAKSSSKPNAEVPGLTHGTTAQILTVVDFLETSRSTNVASKIRPISKPDTATNEPDAPFFNQSASKADLRSAASIHGQSTLNAHLIRTTEQQCNRRSLHTLAAAPRECFVKLLARQALYLPAFES